MIKILFINCIVFGFFNVNAYSNLYTIPEDTKNSLSLLSERSADHLSQIWAPHIIFQMAPNPQIATQNLKRPEENESLCEQEINEEKREQCREEENIKQLLLPYQTPCTKDNPQSCYKRYLNLVLHIPLRLRGYNMQGQFIQEEISDGKYDISVQLVLTPYQGQRIFRLHDEICEKKGVILEGQVHPGFIAINCDIGIPYFKRNAIYKLLVEVKPHDKSLLPFKTFQGSYTLHQGDFEFTGVKRFLDIDIETGERYNKALHSNREIDFFQQMEIEDIVRNEQNLFLEGLGIYHPTLDSKGHFTLSNVNPKQNCMGNTAVVETAVFSGDICLQDKLSRKIYPNTYFRIFIEKPDENGKYFIEEVFPDNPNQPFYKTKGDGCIENLPISLFNKIYIRQKSMRVKVHFLSEELNLYTRIEPIFNPWQKQFQTYVDATEIPDEDSVRFFDSGVERPKLIINQFKNVNLYSSLFVWDNNLDLPPFFEFLDLDKSRTTHLFYRVHFLFQPFIERLGDVAHGTPATSKELMRSGYYMVRILLLRNPQEIGHLRRVFRDGAVNETIKFLSPQSENIDFRSFKDAEYITHTDSIVKAETDFVNLYAPLYLTGEQFEQLLPMNPRHLISVEIMPADPSGLVFKNPEEGSSCKLDLEETTWKPFLDHELVNTPHIGVLDIENWKNWNLLRHTGGLDSDKIIEKSEKGKKYKYFDLRSPERQKDSKIIDSAVRDGKYIPIACTNGLEQAFGTSPSQKQIEECVNWYPFY